MRAADGARVLFLDADLAVDLSHVRPALERLDAGADLVVGCRNVPGARIDVEQGPLRRWMGRGYRRLACRLLGLDVPDVTCGFKGFQAAAGKALFAASTCSGWGIDAEILALAGRSRLTLATLPVTWTHGQASAVRLRRDVMASLGELLAVRRRLRAAGFSAAPLGSRDGAAVGTAPEA
jgi:hypothetical protein